MANDYGYFGSGSTGYAHYKQSTATLAVPVVVAAAGITTVVAAVPAAGHCCLSSLWP